MAFDGLGNLWVADSGNHRVLRFPAGSLDLPNSTADLVLGQPDFESDGRNHSSEDPRIISASGLDTPNGLVFDGQGDLLVSDSSNARVLKFVGPFETDQEASEVLGPSVLSLPISGAQASAVVGQPSFVNTAPNWNSRDVLATAESLFAPGAIYLDRNDTSFTLCM